MTGIGLTGNAWPDFGRIVSLNAIGCWRTVVRSSAKSIAFEQIADPA